MFYVSDNNTVNSWNINFIYYMKKNKILYSINKVFTQSVKFWIDIVEEVEELFLLIYKKIKLNFIWKTTNIKKLSSIKNW